MLNQTLLSKNIEKSFPENVFLILGGRENTPSEFFDSSDAFLAKRISKNNIVKVIKRVDWTNNQIYDTWNSDGDAYYVFNPDNEIVYICIKNNPNGRVDQTGTHLSTQKPSHDTGLYTYSDGYQWLALFKVDYNSNIFLTNSEIPVPDFNLYSQFSTLNQEYSRDCSSGVTSFGACCLYYKEAFKEPFSGITYEAGAITDHTIFSTCYECTDIAEKLNKSKLFLIGVTASGITTDHVLANPLCPQSILVEDRLAYLQNNLNYITPNSSSRFEYNSLLFYQDKTDGILTATIDLSNLTKEQKLVTKSNPKVIVVDPVGTGADIDLLTTRISHGVYEVYGIRVNTPGSNYTLPSFYIENNETSVLNDTIELYLYPSDLFETPTKIIPPSSTVVRTDILEDEIRNNIINTSFTKIALAYDIMDYDTQTANLYGKANSSVYSLQSKVVAKKTYNSEVIPESLVGGYTSILTVPDNGVIENVTKNSYEAYVSAIKNYNGLIYDEANSVWRSGWELSVNDTRGSFEVNDEILIDGESHTVISVEEPVIEKKMEYYSVTPVNIQLPEVNTNKSYSIVIRVNT